MARAASSNITASEPIITDLVQKKNQLHNTFINKNVNVYYLTKPIIFCGEFEVYIHLIIPNTILKSKFQNDVME